MPQIDNKNLCPNSADRITKVINILHLREAPNMIFLQF